MGAMLDGLGVGICVFDTEDCTLAWNRTFLRLFPEHDGRVHVGEPYAHNLRRFYQGRLSADELPYLDRYIAAGVERHRSQSQPYIFEHGGQRIQVASLPLARVGRVRVWRVLSDATEMPSASAATAAGPGMEWLDQVPDGLTVCEGMKSGDVDPRCEVSHCFTISDKALAIGGGALEAVLHKLSAGGYAWKQK